MTVRRFLGGSTGEPKGTPATCGGSRPLGHNPNANRKSSGPGSEPCMTKVNVGLVSEWENGFMDFTGKAILVVSNVSTKFDLFGPSTQ